jgi:hypothetical protein
LANIRPKCTLKLRGMCVKKEKVQARYGEIIKGYPKTRAARDKQGLLDGLK